MWGTGGHRQLFGSSESHFIPLLVPELFRLLDKDQRGTVRLSLAEVDRWGSGELLVDGAWLLRLVLSDLSHFRG